MYYLLSILSGVVIAAMIAVNGRLAAVQGLYLSTVVIHVVGLLLVSVLMAARRVRPAPDRGTPPCLYLGGVIGVATVVFNSLGVGGISLSALTGLGLLGQSITSLAIDRFGWFHMPKRPLDKRKWIGIGVAMLGVLCLLAPYPPEAALPVAVSLAAGATIVTARTVNAGLAGRSGVLKSTFYNYVTGLAVSLLVLAAAGPGIAVSAVSPAPWMFLGGIMGVGTILLSNLIVEKISSFYMTLALFLGQVLAGVGIDTLLSGSFAPENLAGGLFVAAGLLYSLRLNQAARPCPGRPAPAPPPPAATTLPAPSPPDVVFPARPAVSLTCPHCWTGQRAQRDFCYHCGARFVYLEELPQIHR